MLMFKRRGRNIITQTEAAIRAANTMMAGLTSYHGACDFWSLPSHTFGKAGETEQNGLEPLDNVADDER